MPKYIINHVCRHTVILEHIAEPCLYNWDYANLFPEGQQVIPLFNYGCCSRARCKINYQKSVVDEHRYTPAQSDALATLTSGLYEEGKNASDSANNYKFISATKKNEHGAISTTEFEIALQRTNGWILCAASLLQDNAPRFFFDVCVAFAESSIASIIALRISLDRTIESLSQPELGLICLPNEVKLLTKNKKLEELAPQLEHLVIDAVFQKQPIVNATFEWAVREKIYHGKGSSALTNFETLFSSMWLQKVRRADANQVKKMLSKLRA